MIYEVVEGHRDCMYQRKWQGDALPALASESLRFRWLDELRSKVVAGWPAKEGEVPLDRSEALRRAIDDGSILAHEFTSQQGIRLRVCCLIPDDRARRSMPSTFIVLDQSAWARRSGALIR